MSNDGPLSGPKLVAKKIRLLSNVLRVITKINMYL